jgi:hypothetical protein
MRRAPLFLLLAILLAGCGAGTSLECATGTAHADCAKGTEGRALLEQQKQDKKTVSSIDDARCRAYGAQPGSADYIACRRRTTQDRKNYGVQ